MPATRGRPARSSRLTENLDPTLALPDPLQLIESIAIRSDPAAYLRSFQPDQPQFEALRKALIAARGEIPTTTVVTIPDGPLLKLGVEHEQVALLRKRLDVPAKAEDGKETLFDASVDEAVKRFQHGPRRDARWRCRPRHEAAAQSAAPAGGGPGKVQAHPAQHGALALAAERPRAVLRDGQFARVHAPRGGRRQGRALDRVVVGKPDNQTPVFSNEMQEIVFNPYWNVPNAIKTEELLPLITGGADWFGGGVWNTSVLERHGLRVNLGGREVDPSRLDWSRTDIRSLNIYQPPGPDNVLGTVKFVFPNKHDVYMHDTPQKNLFAQPVRAESHGCMRVQNPDQLALTLLKQDQGWSAAKSPRRSEGLRPARGAEAEDPGLHHLFHPLGERRRLDLDLQRHLWPRCAHGGRAVW